MKLVPLIIACICILLETAMPQERNGWRGIVPLHSTRVEVEAILGPGSGACKCIYKTDRESVEVHYASAPCKGSPPGWNVASETVLSITVTPKEWQRFADLRIDEVKFVRTFDPDNRTVRYTNSNEGTTYTLTETGMVYYVSYMPSRDDSQLRCKGFSQNPETINQYSRFDYYSDISFKDEKARLDNFAAWLRQHPDLKGYIVVYGRSRPRRSQEALKRASRAKQYLVNIRHTSPERLVTISAGIREKLEVELYALPSNLPAPIPSSSPRPIHEETNASQVRKLYPFIVGIDVECSKRRCRGVAWNSAIEINSG